MKRLMLASGQVKLAMLIWTSEWEMAISLTATAPVWDALREREEIVR
jgi:hypothetical protein